ncbi:MAG: phenylalanine--tRNA ligase subunit alpha [Ruminococcaceae bacterium]|nr:phenylalanine--tRNA ligase subunit alpha [Oscillospiraceae bacterium]
MNEKIEQLRKNIKEALSVKLTREEFKKLREQYLSTKAGEIPNLMKEMRNVPKEDRPQFGKIINEFKNWAEQEFAEVDSAIKKEELAKANESEAVDITMPARKNETGSLHPTTIVKQEIIKIFAGLGFDVFEGPEIETDYYNFTALNVPSDHPARAEQDTFYITENILLRTQTSPGQIRTMEAVKPPIKVLSPGRVFRSDYDATHSPMFHQMEGLVVDKNISVCDLYGMLDLFAKEMFSSEAKTRLRPSYFPFTEPSVEVDVTCCECGGSGCRLCKGTGWIEVLGGGIVNRKVLENCGIDPEEYSGLAFGIGIDRITMLKYGINNIHILFENDIRTLRQFKQQNLG